MVLRSVIGALVAVAVLGAVAVVLPERTPFKAAAVQTQFGDLPKPPFAAAKSTATGSPDVNEAARSLLKTAVFERNQPVQTAAPIPVAIKVNEIITAPPAQPVPEVLAYAPASGPAPAVAATAAAILPPAASSPVPEPLPHAQERAAEVQVPSSKPATAVAVLDPQARPQTASAGDHVNINTAPVGVLDHIPGAGRIGVAIARRRPYASVEDLVRKRVLRKTAFERIRSVITVN